MNVFDPPLILLDVSAKKLDDKANAYTGIYFGQLRSPLTKYRLSEHYPYGIDNGCFSGELPKAFFRLVEEAKNRAPLFVTMPDKVGDAERTTSMFYAFLSANIERLEGLPLAYVLQDGVKLSDVPWGYIEAVFVGGTDAFKQSKVCFDCLEEAGKRGLWRHMGRVNTKNRYVGVRGLVDSVDGSGISRFDHMLESMLACFFQGRLCI